MPNTTAVGNSKIVKITRFFLIFFKKNSLDQQMNKQKGKLSVSIFSTSSSCDPFYDPYLNVVFITNCGFQAVQRIL